MAFRIGLATGNPKKEIDMDALNAITGRVLSYTPPQKGKNKKRAEDETKYPPHRKGPTSLRDPKKR